MTAIAIALLILLAASEVYHGVERAKLLNRIMAKDLPEFNYYQAKFKKDVKETEKLREEAREERKADKKEDEEEEDPNDLY